MLPALSLPLGLSLVLLQQAAPEMPDTRYPWTTEDALRSLPKSRGPVASVGDLDGDDSPDVILLQRVEDVERLTAFSVRDGREIRTLWERRSPKRRGLLPWDAGGDADGDGIADVVIGLSGDDRGGGDAGAVLVLSGATGQALREIPGKRAKDRLGTAVAWLGDVDDDGLDDFVVGAHQVPAGARLYPARPVKSYTSSWCGNGEKEDRVVFEDGESVLVEDLLHAGMQERSAYPGYVAAYSSRTGMELWRAPGTLRGHGFGASVCAIGDHDGDGVGDVIALADRNSAEPALVLSGATGVELARMEHRYGLVGYLGDVDADGVGDLYFDGGEPMSTSFRSSVTEVRSGKTLLPLFRHEFPDWASNYCRTSWVGDVDGDGHDDLALGDANLHLRGPNDPGAKGVGVTLEGLTLEEACELPSNPWCAMTPESGCLWIVSGRTREILVGIWGLPGSRDGIGMQTTSVPDITGDGFPDLVVSGFRATLVFPGPGGS